MGNVERMSARGSARTTSWNEPPALTADLKPGREVEIELTQGTRVAGKVIQVDEQGVVLECAADHERARIAVAEIADVIAADWREHPSQRGPAAGSGFGGFS
jgi:exosome complex RNA-binding protein Csl4